jgi:L-aspartate oxidase
LRSTVPAPAAGHKSPVQGNGNANETEKFIQRVQAIMWKNVGVVRDGGALKQTVAELTNMQSSAPKSGDRRSHEANNILQTGLLVARSALAREESRGAHYRLDFPLRDDRKFGKHSVVCGDSLTFE